MLLALMLHIDERHPGATAHPALPICAPYNLG